MKGKASDICPKCNHCEGLDRFVNMYSCKHYNKYPDSAIGMDSEIECCNFEEVDTNKVEGKVSDWCPKCKNCKGTTQEYNGKTASIRLTEVECEDPYDGMIKTLAADSDVCCSMFEMKSEKSCDKISLLQHELEMDKLRRKIHELEKEKAAHMKGINRLKKSNEKLQNQVKNLQITNEEAYKREEKLEEKLKKANELAESWKRDYEFIRDKLVHPIYNILYPDNPNLDINVTKLVNYVKDLKVYYEENGSMYKEVQEWREKCIARGKDIDHLLSENKEKDRKISDQEITIKALLITIKEMCKEENENA